MRKALARGSGAGAAPEALLGSQLRHPNIVATLKWAARKLERPNAGMSIMTSMDEGTGTGKVGRWRRAWCALRVEWGWDEGGSVLWEVGCDGAD